VFTALAVLTATITPSASALGPVLRSNEIGLGDLLPAASGRPAGWQPPTGTAAVGDDVEPVVLIPAFDTTGSVLRYRVDDGSFDGELTPDGDGLQRARALAIGDDGLVYVADADGDQVVRYDPVHDTLVDVFVAAGSGGLSHPRGLAFGPDGNLVVASAGSNQLLEFDGRTGQPLGVLVDGLNNPGGLVFSGEGDLLATSQNDDAVHLYVDGVLHRSVDLGPGVGPVDITIGSEGTVFVALMDGGRVDRFDLGALEGERADAAVKVESVVTSELVSPSSVAVGPDGALWVADQWTDRVHRFDPDTGQLLDTIIESGTPFGPSDVVIYPDASTGPARVPGDGNRVGPGAGVSAADWLGRQPSPGGRGRGGLRFEANDGSAAPDLDFVAHGRDYGVVLAGADAIVSPEASESEAIRLDFVGAADDPQPRTPTSETAPAVVYEDIYPGVDLTYRDNSGDLEYLVTVGPGADPDVVSFGLSNATDVELTRNGSIQFRVPSGGAMELTAPVAYQERDGIRLDVDSRFQLRADGTVGFEVGSYDSTLALIIDPIFRASTSADSGGGNSITIARPAGVTTGDVLLASIAQPNDGAVTPPAGWTLIRSDVQGTSVRQDLFYRVATGSEPASYVFNLAQSGQSAGAIVAYDGVDTTSPIDVHGGQANTASASYTAPSVTPTVSGATLVAFYANTTGTVTTPPAGMTERADHPSAAGATEIADEELVSAGSTGTRTATGTSSVNIGQLVALTPDDPAASSIGRWRLDEGSGPTAVDSSGYGHDGTITAATYTAGVSATGLDFTGSSGERVVVGDPVDGSLDPGTGDFSVSAWFRTTVKPGSSEFDQLVYKSDGSEGYELFLADGGSSPRLTFRVRDDGSSWTVLHVAPMDDGGWHHAAGVMDGSNLYLYLDGTLVDTQPHAAADVDTAEQLAFGAEENGLAWSDYEGDLDEISIYGRALTAGEVAALAVAPRVTVNSTSDASDNNQGDGLCDTGGTNSEGDPECTLRAAIEEANASTGVDTIHFAIPSSDPGYSASPLSYAFTPAAPYDYLLEPVTLDASTQSGWAGDPIIELDGTSAVGATAGLAIRTNDSTIRGFIVHSFPDEGLEIDGSTEFGDRNTLTNNWVGLDAAGTVVGNTDHGILVTVDALDNLVGGTGANDGNLVAGSGGVGILVRTNSTGNALLGNEVHGNGSLGIDLDEDGVTANDAGDGDSGSNDLLNFPEVTSAEDSGGTVSVTFDLDVPANPDQYRVEFFTNPSGTNGAGNYEAETFVSAVTTPPGTGLTHSFAGSAGDVITATATRIDTGAAYGYSSTSEISAAYTVTAAGGIPDGLLLSSAGDVGSPSGAPGLDSWSAGSVLHVGEPSLAYEPPSTGGTFSLIADLDAQGQDGNVVLVGLDLVETATDVGASPTVSLLPGDLLLSTANDETFVNWDTSTTEALSKDVILFRPQTPGDYSSGTFSVLLDQPLGTVVDVSLVEADTMVGDQLLPAGSILMTDSKIVYHLDPTGAGPLVVPGVPTVLLDGPDVAIDQNIVGVHLVDAAVRVDGIDLTAGDLLVSIDNTDAAVGDNGIAVVRQDVFLLELTRTTAGPTGLAAGDATLFFDGSDVGLDVNDEDLWGIALVGGTPITTPSAVDDTVRTSLNTPWVVAPLVNDEDPNGDPLSIQSFTQPTNGTVADNGDGTLTYSPDYGHSGADAFTYTATDVTESAVATVTVDVRTPELWTATKDPVVASGTAGLTSWTTGQVLSLGDPGLALDPPTTSATVAEVVDLDRFASDGVAKIGAIHEMRTAVTVGTGPTAFDLEPGDLVLVSDAGETFYGDTTVITVSDSDVFVFRPDAPGDLSSPGEFHYLLENPASAGTAHALTVVEEPTIVGDTFLTPGTLLFSSSSDPKRLMRYTVDATGLGTTAGTLTEVADLADVGLGGTIEGIDLIERDVTLGGRTLDEGTVLLTTDGETTVAGLPVERWDLFAVDITATTLVAGTTSATATLVFDGSDTGFDDNTESLFATYVSGTDDLAPGNSAPVAADDTATTAQGVPVTIDVVANDSDADTDPLSLIDMVDGTNGTVVDNGDGTLTYSGGTAFSGTDVFAYTISDGNGSTDTALVTVTVTPHSLPRAVYRRSGQTAPRHQAWDGTIFGGELVSATVGEFRIIQGAESPSRDEAIVVGVDNATGTIAGERWNGSSWTALPSLGSTTQTYWWSFDVAYEAVSGDAMVVYADGADLRYRVWNGSTWSAEASIAEPLVGTPRQMQLASHPWADEMVLVVSDDSSQDYALVWDGSAWGNPVTLHAGGAGDRTDVYVAYEQQSGTALVVYGKGTEDVYHRTWNGGWSSEAQRARPGGVAGYARWTTLAADPTTDRIALGVLTDGADVWLAVWDGAAWVNVTAATTTASGTNRPAVAVAFEGTSGQALAAYSGVDNTPEYRTWAAGTGWSAQANALDIGNDPNSVMLYPNPVTDEVMLATQDSASDLQYTYWNGTTWVSVNEVTTNTGDTKNQPFLFLWNAVATPLPTNPVVTVNSSGDGGDSGAGDHACDTGGTNSEGDPECTLRAAIEEANASTVVDTIEFAIPASDPGHSSGIWTVSPGSALPQLDAAVTIDATTQTGYSGSPVVELDGSALGAGADGLVVGGTADGVAVSGVAVTSFPDDGITINGDNTVVTDSYIGLSADGVTAAGNGTEGIVVQSTATGTSLVDNVVSGQTTAAAIVIGNDSTGTVLTGNLIGTAADGLTTIGNRSGIWSNTTGSFLVGGTTAADANTIVASEFDAITFVGTGTMSVLGNTITGNGGIGLDLDDDGVTANDAGDGDTGANGLLNHPVLTAPVSGDTTVGLDLDVQAGDYRIEVFTNPTEGADPSGYGEGESLVAAQTVTHTGSGPESFVVAIPAVFAGDVLSATATEDPGGGSYGATSEFSTSVTVLSAADPVIDASVRRSDVFADGGLDPASSAIAGTAGSALTFNGGGDLLRGPALDITDAELSVSAWIRPAALGGTDYVVSKRTSGGDPVFELGVDGTGQAVATLGIGGGPVTVQGGTISTGTWHQLAVAWDGTTVRLYVDGSEADTAPASGSLRTDTSTDVILGNRSTGTSGFDGEIDHVEIGHLAPTATEISVRYSTVADQALTVTVGQQQTDAPGAWIVSGLQARSGGFALAAPETADSGAAAWAVATGINEPGTVFETWWWASIATGVDLASGTRAGQSPTDQFDAAYIGAGTWDLRRRSGAVDSVDGSGTQALTTGAWVKVEQWTDQNGDSRLLVDGVEVAPWTAQTAPPAGGSLGLRVGRLPGGQSWYVDDPRARRLVMPEPTATLGPLDRD
jgi:CSLREA domain-containing protein